MSVLVESRSEEAVVDLVEEPMVKKVFYHTFGSGHKFSGYCQPIMASSPWIAEEKMFELHGKQWAFQYLENEFKILQKQGLVTHKMLPLVETQ